MWKAHRTSKLRNIIPQNPRPRVAPEAKGQKLSFRPY
ncbi:hypothetical protein BVRB_7g176800 [Beta vulgaris subsp. vulgaris]|nr:hypothetical protein BVRB_7g176800 [Beta vulgaris subsp. vulgaris]